MPSVTAAESEAPALSPRRRALLEAALHVVAEEGLRGLTHRAVDRRAGLPEGTCSAYFRTREALQTGLTAYVAAQCGQDVRDLADQLAALGTDEPGLPERVVTTVVEAFESWLDEGELILARIELSMEGSRNPALAAVLAEYRDRLVAVVDATLASRGKRHDGRTAEALVAASDGLLVAALQKPPAERRPFLSESLRLILHALTEA
ncbi:TetR family transcriptional regulator [Nocardioides anomalus]|uniref:TetR family transcriptional regulator n=1 Tax=Nocardioides anomalus TaxID=2712223 RepID=A0A6G6WA91_9ACTN|nr:TetR family transcriptional regulator [Nocardioides anomalus]QIG42136.1 TetR family transcriptional regulator [Nocardioides anomalus]